MKLPAPVLVALAAVAAVIVPYLALGGASYQPAPVGDPCRTRAWRDPGRLQEALEQVALSALDGAACRLDVSREELVLALADEQSLDAFAAKHEISTAAAEHAVRDGLVRAVEDAEEAVALSGDLAQLVRSAVQQIPPRLALALLQQLGSWKG